MANPHPTYNPHPNMNIANEIKTGPTTEYGKLKSALRGLKPLGTLKKNNNLNRMIEFGTDSGEARKILNELFRKSKYNASKRYNLFVLWLKAHTTKQLREIVELENIYWLVQDKVAVSLINKTIEGKPLTPADIEQMKFLKDCLETLHNLKFGKKQVNVNTSFKDVRDLMGFDKTDEIIKNETIEKPVSSNDETQIN